MFSEILYVISIVISCGVLKVSTLQLNFTGGEIDYVNREYFDVNASLVTNENENNGLTRIPVTWNVHQALPTNTKLKTTIIQYDTSEKNTGSFFKIEVSLCDLKDKLHQYLDPFYLKVTRSGHCVQPGIYHIENAGEFHIEKYIKPEDIKGAVSFETKNVIESPDVVLLKYDIYSKPV